MSSEANPPNVRSQSEVIRMNSAELNNILGYIADLQEAVEELRGEVQKTKTRLSKNQNILKALWKKQQGTELSTTEETMAMVLDKFKSAGSKASSTEEILSATAKELRASVHGQREKYLNRRIAKYFGKKVYFGTISEVWMDGTKPKWHVLYDDNDEEDFNKTQLMNAISLYTREKKRDPKWSEEENEKIAESIRTSVQQVTSSTLLSPNEFEQTTDIDNRMINLADMENKIMKLVDSSMQSISDETANGIKSLSDATANGIDSMAAIKKDMEIARTEAETKVSKLADDSIQSISDESSNGMKLLSESITILKESIAEETANALKSLSDATTNSIETISTTTSSTESELSKLTNASVQSVSEATSNSIESIKNDMEMSKTNVEKKISKLTDESVQSISNATAEGIESITSLKKDMEMSKTDAEKKISKLADASMQSLSDVESKITKLTCTSLQSISDAENKLTQLADDSMQSISESTAKGIENISTQTAISLEKIHAPITTIKEDMEISTSDADNKISVHPIPEEMSMQSISDATAIGIESITMQTTTSLATIEEFAKKIQDDFSNDCEAAVKKSTKNLKNELAKNEKNLKTELARNKTKILNETKRNTTKLQTEIKNNTASLKNELKKTMTTLKTEVEKKTENLKENISKAETVAERLSKLSNQPVAVAPTQKKSKASITKTFDSDLFKNILHQPEPSRKKEKEEEKAKDGWPFVNTYGVPVKTKKMQEPKPKPKTIVDTYESDFFKSLVNGGKAPPPSPAPSKSSKSSNWPFV